MRERSISMMSPVALGLVLIALCPGTVLSAWGFNSGSVLLKDIEVLTLYNGKMTQGQRSSPVPQLECVHGGTAPCSAFKPRVVQCYNRGWDGVDVQWECKTDMDNAFRFGDIEVSCEGYSSRDDPYVLKGSCGLRYSIDYTKEGLNQKQGHHHNYYGDQTTGYESHASPGNHGKQKLSSASYFADLIVLVAAALMCWAFYKTCIQSSRRVGQDAHSNTNDDYPAGGGGGGGGYGWFGQGSGGGTPPTAPPPPAGFQSGYRDDASCRNRTAGGAAGGSSGGGGFWSGAAAGGLLGYMFGRGGQNNYGGGYGRQRPWGGNSGWGSSSWGGGGGGFSGGGGGGGSTGTRTSSGFGGTSRR
ncbi:store-operated calcium entry-associated regulatory factor-like [Homarus americanus]|uniref:Store-operated calcium entry-associated regulatory factor n=1 Tax=Homarus americanus TaxID=6706 RepID=A0A8J5JZX3_HOMAM|nr:store-operated calcium entry-associated regulatory factor-like [Homarus americanus]KAG7164455.1 Store-operated calcium entry-associated regulatory factor-like [Homarus americanus]